MKKFWTLLALPFLALTSCGGQNRMYGTYSFMLGKDKPDETHFGVEVTLSDTAYQSPSQDPDLKDAKNLELKLNLSPDIIPKEPPEEDTPNYYEALFVWLAAQFLQAGVPGYYLPKEGLYDEGQRLAIGYDLSIDPELFPFEIGSNFVENFIVAYYDGNARSVKLILPTSLVDLQDQLFWYGYFIDLNVENLDPDYPDPADIAITLVELATGEGLIATEKITNPDDYKIDLPNPRGRVDRIGTHPTSDDVDTITKNPNYTKLITDVAEKSDKEKFSFRDYHSLTIELQKQ